MTLGASNHPHPTLSGSPKLPINKADLTASIANQNKVYGDDDPALASITPTLTGAINRTVATWNGSATVNDTSLVSTSLASLTRQTGESVGAYDITAASFAPRGASVGNYNTPTLTGSSTLPIAVTPPNVTLAAMTK